MTAFVAAATPFSLALDQAVLSAEGVADFEWPIARREMAAVRDTFEAELLGDMRPALANDDPDWSVAHVLMYEIARDVAEGWLCLALWRRLAQHGRALAFPSSGYGAAQALLRGETLPPPVTLAALRRGLPAPPRWAMPLRWLRHAFVRDSFVRRRVSQLKTTDVACISSAPFVAQHAAALAAETGQHVVLCSFWEWFALAPGDAAKAAVADPISDATIGRILTHARAAFAAGGEVMPDALERGIRAWVGEASRWVRFYMDRMRSRPDRLPRNLWYGSTNNWWTRMLRAAVQEAGGRCVGHDHGRGVGVYPNEGEHGPVFDLCDEYVSYSPVLARALEAIRPEIVRRLPRGGAGPIFSSAPAGCLLPPKLGDAPADAPQPMYVAPLYLGGRVAGMNCLPHDLVWLDWQAKLFGKLRPLVDSLAFKHHPESLYPVPSTLLELAHAKVIGGTIETCHRAASVFICDFLSTPFKTMVHTDCPIVVVDHGIGRMSPEIRALIERRCAIVDGGYDGENRLSLRDWSSLAPALADAERRRKDRSCGEALFGYPR